MDLPGKDCILCQGEASDPELGRTEVWRDELWRLTTSIGPGDPTPGFSYLEPRRHVPHITDLAGDEAATFGTVLARCSAALKQATGADVVFAYVFGTGIPHLHLHLAPHREGDALSDAMFKGEVVQIPTEAGYTRLVCKDYPALPDEDLRAAADRARQLLASRWEI
jgi:diadenosine tetraphosphate (Ap4A) HIT family hydrolase